MSLLAATERSIHWEESMRRWRIRLIAAIGILGTLGGAWLVQRFSVIPAIAILTWLGVVAIAWWPRLGLYAAFGLVLLFEAGGPDPLMLPGMYINGGLGSTVGIPGAIASPLELLLVLTLFFWLAKSLASRRLSIEFRGGSLGWPMLVFTVCLFLGVARGVADGGTFNNALWESRFLFYTVICYILTSNVVRTRAHVHTLTRVALLAVGIFAVEGAYRRLVLVNTGALRTVKEFYYAHDTSVFLGFVPLLCLAVFVFKSSPRLRAVSLLLTPLSLFTLLATERRAGQIAFMIMFLILACILFATHRKTFYWIMVPLLLMGAIYLPIFWRASGILAEPARAVRSLTEPDARDAASNAYRDAERENVRATIKANPILGVGFGKEFYFVIPMADLSWWPFWRYEPHIMIHWVWLKVGVYGFISFWVLFATALMRGAHLVKVLRLPELRLFAVLAVFSLVGLLVFSYVDLGLVSGRVTVVLGTALGGIAVLDRIEDETMSELPADTANAD